MTELVEGLAELDKALNKLDDAIGFKTLRESLRDEAKPIANDIKQRMTVDTGAGRDSVRVTSNKASKKGKGYVAQSRILVGGAATKRRRKATHIPVQELGGKKRPAKPTMVPAFNAGADGFIERFKKTLGRKILKASQSGKRTKR
ncbi:hypothetical protein FLL45_01545 [Aliikangiella marina]|uniref:HK97 gp10 family phage protein n=1 Tax=Aliikangiella marina TaxID=1712262 RepID=A0A545THN9_9GAMM|nr:HK97-gp10 family putative phage morphogenesis protein [Aliikangiella marina]TQV76671.1 hypothetical protein FLL45_01545 [Aliikangiella marina]